MLQFNLDSGSIETEYLGGDWLVRLCPWGCIKHGLVSSHQMNLARSLLPCLLFHHGVTHDDVGPTPGTSRLWNCEPN
jgi:diadenosine tetraphosphatase ApaH/serine/threonine PP2A family protein phosphatase